MLRTAEDSSVSVQNALIHNPHMVITTQYFANSPYNKKLQFVNSPSNDNCTDIVFMHYSFSLKTANKS